MIAAMRWARSVGRWCAIAMPLVIVAGATPAVAGQPAHSLDLSIAAGLPPPADTGKPAVAPRAGLALPRPGDCVAPLPCGTRLLGAIRKDGAVELQVPAWRW